MSEKKQNSQPETPGKNKENPLKIAAFGVGALVAGAGISLLAFEHIMPYLQPEPTVAPVTQQIEGTYKVKKVQVPEIVDIQLPQIEADLVAPAPATKVQNAAMEAQPASPTTVTEKIVEKVTETIIEKPSPAPAQLALALQKFQLGYAQAEDFTKIDMKTEPARQSVSKLVKTLEGGVMRESVVLAQVDAVQPVIQEPPQEEATPLSVSETAPKWKTEAASFLSQFVKVRKVTSTQTAESEDIRPALKQALWQRNWTEAQNLIAGKQEFDFVNAYVAQQKALAELLENFSISDEGGQE